MAKTLTRTIDLEPIDRLEEKLKLLVGLVERLRAEQATLAEANARLSRDLEAARASLAAAEGAAENELVALREERDVIRGRVSEMLEQIEALNL